MSVRLEMVRICYSGWWRRGGGDGGTRMGRQQGSFCDPQRVRRVIEEEEMYGTILASATRAVGAAAAATGLVDAGIEHFRYKWD